MSLTDSSRQQFEDQLNAIATELVMASPASADGLVPIYALVNELEPICEDDPTLCEAIGWVKECLDYLLDAALPFDSDTLAYLGEFSTWAQTAIFAIKEGKEPQNFRRLRDGEALDQAPTVGNVESISGESTSSAPPTAEDEVAKVAAETDVLIELNLEEDRELLAEFYTEATDHLEQIEAALLVLETNPTDENSLASLFRSFHTIKGVAGFLHLVPVNRLAHDVESLMDHARNGKFVINTRMITVILQSRDTISKLVDQINHTLETSEQPSTLIPVSALIVEVRNLAQAALAGEDAPPAVAVETPPAETPVAAPKEASPVPAPSAIPPAAQEAKAESTTNSRGPATIRVNTVKLDNLMDTVGELVITQSQLAESARTDTSENTVLQRNLSQLSRITKELQHTSMALRMIPVKQTFQRVGRMVRDLSESCGKKVHFDVHGEDTELDRNVVEQIGDPLVHMVRNSLDHGIECSEDRVAAGKSDYGTVTLKAYHLGSNIVIELADDGRGLPKEKILKKAVEKGVIAPGVELPDNEIYSLIFAPGFSTADQVTDISGRGVGMDVVKKNIEKLRGMVEIESNPGQGTTFKIKLPLTMAIIDGLVVRVGEDKFILPTTSVKVALRPTKDQLSKIQGKMEVLELRGKSVPIVRLYEAFHIDSRVRKAEEGIVVIIETMGQPFGLLVDDMVSKQEVVIKNLGSMIQGVKGVAGGAILGDGSIALILDPGSLTNRNQRATLSAESAA